MPEDLEDRVRSLERENNDLKSDMKLMQRDLTYIKDSIDKWNTGFGRIVFIVGGGILSALVAWILRGGLDGGQ